jgi:hypothetical protein
MQKLLQLTALLTLLSSCSSGPTLTDQASGEFSAQGLYQVQSPGFTSVYVHPDAGLPAYRTVNIEQLDLSDIEIGATTVTGTLRRDWQMTPERESSLQSVWGDAMNRAFGDYERATSGEETLRISAAITRVAPGRPTATTVGGGLQPMGSSQDVVEIFMEFRLYNQDSGQLLAVIRDSRTMISQAMSRTGPVAVQTMFRSWAALLHTRVSGR